MILDAACLDKPASLAPNQAPLPAEAPRAPRRPCRAARPVVRTLKTAAERPAGPAAPSPRPAAAGDAGVPVGLASAGSAGGTSRRCRELASLKRRPRLGEHYRALAGGCGGSALPAAGATVVDPAWGRPGLVTGQGHSHMSSTAPGTPGVGLGAAGGGVAQPEFDAAKPAATLRGAAHSSLAAESSGPGGGMPACATRSYEAALPLAGHAGPGGCSLDDTADDGGLEAAACAWASAAPRPAADNEAARTCAPAAGSSGASTPVSAVGQGWAAEDGGSSSCGSVCSDLERMALVDECDCLHEGTPGRSGSGLAALDLADSSPRQWRADELDSAHSPAAGAPGIAAELLPCGSANGSPVSTGAETPKSACAATRQPAPLDVDGTWAAHEHANASPRAQQLLDSAPSPCAAEAHAVHVGPPGDPQGAQVAMLDGDPGCTVNAGARSSACAAEAARQRAAAEDGHACADPASAQGEAGCLAAHGLDACALAVASAGQQALAGGGVRLWGALVTVAEGKAAELPSPEADACTLAAVSAPSQPDVGDECAWADMSSAIRDSAGSAGGDGGVSLGSSRSSAAGTGCCEDACADGGRVRAQSLPVQPGSPLWPPAPIAPAHDSFVDSISGDSWPPGAHARAPHRSTARASSGMRGSACARAPEPGAGEQENWAGLSALACSPGATRGRRESNPEGQRRDWAALAEQPLLRQPLRQTNPARFQTPSPAMSPPAVPACAAPAGAGSCRASAPSADHAIADLPQRPAAAAPSLPGPAWELRPGTQGCMQHTPCSAADRYRRAEGMDSGVPAPQHERPLLCVLAGSMEVEASAGSACEHADHPPCVGVRVSCDEPKAASGEASCMAEPAERTAASEPCVNQAVAPDSSGEVALCCAAEQPEQAPFFSASTAHGGEPGFQGESRRGRMRLLAAARRRAGRPALLAEGACRAEALGGHGAAGVANHIMQSSHQEATACMSGAAESCAGDLARAAGASAAAEAAAALAAPGAGMLSEGGLDKQSFRAVSASDASRRGCQADAGAAELRSPTVLCAALDREAAAPAAGSQASCSRKPGVPAACVPSAPACGQAGPALPICNPHSAELPSEACGGAVVAGGSGTSLNAEPHRAAVASWSSACSSAGLHAMPYSSAEVAGSSKLNVSHDTPAGSVSGRAGQSHMVFDPILCLYFDAVSGQVFEEVAVMRRSHTVEGA